MFTGLIEDLGSVRTLQRDGDSGRITISTALPLAEIRIGDSIAVNGACLTVTSLGDGMFTADVSPESLARTTLGELQTGQRVNLERALRVGDRLGGHLVSGHVDGVGQVVERVQERNTIRFTIKNPPTLSRYLVEKGSVCIDGISLTVNAVGRETFSLTIIPLSLAKTTLQDRKTGSRVNIETDILGKYVERLLRYRETGQPASGSVDLDFLAKHGFL
ncbi:MAG: riboflavin synthase [Syntrophotaleaceae bacterium]